MTIASRTPEGRSHYCPLCDTTICVEPSQPPGDAPCPQCGTLLWFATPIPRPAVQKFFARDGYGRPMDEQGNILDPVTGAVDFAATFAAVEPVPVWHQRTRERLWSLAEWLWQRLLELDPEG
jgi:hypothetical protein